MLQPYRTPTLSYSNSILLQPYLLQSYLLQPYLLQPYLAPTQTSYFILNFLLYSQTPYSISKLPTLFPNSLLYSQTSYSIPNLPTLFPNYLLYS